MVRRVEVEPIRPCGQRILRTLQRVPRRLTKRYAAVFTRLAIVKVTLRLAHQTTSSSHFGDSQEPWRLIIC
jgi:hypothetical protein